ncbi:MAG TPA: efflux transporter outer membrane subunit [Opitutaceae bacterium]|nr:efflux transporter outer membrane subunit [Opitutaceae bacterium]
MKKQLHQNTAPSLRAAWLRLAAACLVLAAGGCAVGPNYRRPQTAVPASFKEADGWKPATPNDAADRGPWWELFQDPILNQLEGEAIVSNQSLREAVANYEEARQLARADHATLFPSLSATGSYQRVRRSSGSASSTTASGATAPTAGGSSDITTTAQAGLQAGWAPDFWGRIRRLSEADIAAAQASAADLANARLSIQAVLAQDYILLRVADERQRLYAHAVGDYQRTLEISQNKYKAGIAARSDVISAQAQLDSVRAQQIDAGVQRAQLEHAIAVLLGHPPAEFSLAPQPALVLPAPAIPAQLPSALLERRPDIAAAERAVAEANARVGVQIAGYFPDITLSGEAGYQSSTLDRLFRTANRTWSLGANLSETIFDFGQRRAEVLQARAAYDATVAAYRQTVLSAFQGVEDDLSTLRLLGEEAAVQSAAVTEAADAARIALNEYNAGIVDYTTVVTAQVAELNARQSALTTLQTQRTTSVALLEALGGGWTAADLPSSAAVLARNPPNRLP